MKNDICGVILAAGIGSRLRPMTKNKPKCLVRVAGKALIDYQLEAYKKAGVSEVFVVVGYEGDAVVDHCRHVKGISVRIVNNHAYEETNNMYSLYLVREMINGRPFIVNNGDLCVDDQVVSALLLSDCESAVAVDPLQYDGESMKVSLGDNGKICDISKEIDVEKSAGCSIDFYKFSVAAGRRFIDEVRRIVEVEKNRKDWTEVAMQRLFISGELNFGFCDISHFDWVEVDNCDDLLLADRKFSGFDKAFDKAEAVILDLDGTVHVGGHVIKGVSEALNKMVENGKHLYYMSNNSSKNKAYYQKKLEEFGLPVCVGNVLLSTDGLVDYLKSNEVRKVYVLGTEYLINDLKEAGIECVGAASVGVEYVVVGYDTELTYEKLVIACGYINAGIDFIATHSDVSCPTSKGPVPDAGALIRLLEATTGKAPAMIFGKPSPGTILELFKERGIDIKKTMVFGDRFHTDIKLSENLGCDSVLILTGDASREEIDCSEIVPTYIISSLADVY